MKLTKTEILVVAKLANLPIKESELDLYSDQLSEIISYIHQLNSVDTKGVEPTFNISPVENVWQPDHVEPSLTQDQALANAPAKKDGFFITEGVFGDE